jgi:PGF-CTERM protein
VTDNDTQTAQIEITDPTPTPTPEPSLGSDDDDDPPQFSSELTEQESGAVLEFSDATANRRYTVNLGDSIQSNNVIVSGTEMFFERSVNDGTIEFTADGSMPDGAQELAGALVYISVETEDVSDEDLVEVEMEFTVPTSVLNEEGISPDNFQLYRFEDGQWVVYETSHQGDGEFVADEIPGFSMFAIGPAGAAEATSEQTPTATPTPEPTDTPTPEPTDTPTPEPTETSTPEPTETEVTEPTTTATVEQTTTSTQFPGFTPAVALIAMLIASLIVARFSRR